MISLWWEWKKWNDLANVLNKSCKFNSCHCLLVLKYNCSFVCFSLGKRVCHKTKTAQKFCTVLFLKEVFFSASSVCFNLLFRMPAVSHLCFQNFFFIAAVLNWLWCWRHPGQFVVLIYDKAACLIGCDIVSTVSYTHLTLPTNHRV